MQVWILLAYPLLALPFLMRRPKKTFLGWIILGHALLVVFFAGRILLHPSFSSRYFQADALARIFLPISAVCYLAVAFYNVSYIRRVSFSGRWGAYYSMGIMLFAFSMLAAILSTHLALFWVFIEATTLFSAPLIFFEQSRQSLEAAWKYIFINSIGIMLALVGIILLASGTPALGSLFFKDLAAGIATSSPFWLKISFVFILAGFGTKMGLAPFHAWLPDAHSEAPAPVSALLSGSLLNTAFLGILRMLSLLDRAGAAQIPKQLLIVTGFLSILVGAAFTIRTDNYKRLLAYSSIENMGILSLAAGLGGMALPAVFLHLLGHSFAKTSCFLVSGNIFHLTRSRKVSETGGLWRKSPANGWLWMISFLAVSAFPPFPSFFSKLLVIQEFLSRGQYILLILFLLLLTVVLWGMGSRVLRMVSGPGQKLQALTWDIFFDLLPPLFLLILLIGLGLGMPISVQRIVHDAAAALTRGP